jgi:quercetin dioxygenase-like cupin family protein
MADRFEDDRGVIQDLFDGEPVAVTRITTVTGKVRGNHVHERTTQWTLVVTGALRVANSESLDAILLRGDIMVHKPGDPHAWIALADTDCLVFTRGPRSGEDYETDTIRLTEPLITP